ncbi:MAG: lipopolysaccharide heptosyltransferase II [Syntrophorhabdaceae bacterium]
MTGKTIVYLPNWLGDMVMAVPFLHTLRKHCSSEIWALGKDSAVHLYNGLDLFDRFVSINNGGYSLFVDTANKLKKEGFKRAIALPHSFRSTLFFCNLRVREIVGYARNKRGFMLSLKVKESPGLESTVEHYLRIADALSLPRSLESPILSITADEEDKFDQEFTGLAKPYAVMVIGAQFGPSKCWPTEYFSDLANNLIDTYGMNIYMLPGRNETDIADMVYAGIVRKDHAGILSMNIRDMKVCLSRAACVISNDTGPRHIAAALGTPTIVLAGPMDERYTSYENPYTYVLAKDVPCRPCNRKKCDRGHECMRDLKPREVTALLGDILENRN